ncbi:B12-binding domain-containing radical SAM protein [archaeon]|nr:B12-binding domain-containing radical SAM protein [archaeon]
MKITLISPNLSTSDRYGKALGKVGPTTEPLGLAYLASAIKQNRNDFVEIIDSAALDYGEKELFNHLKKTNPDIIGVTVLTPMYIRATETINVAKRACPNAKIIVGGAHVTIFPKQILEENEKIDYAVIGEGEITIIELLNAIEKNKVPSSIKGIGYRNKKSIKINQLREFITDLDIIPLPARKLLPMKKYKPAPTYYNKLPSYIMLTSRGCPYRCIYCSKIFGRTYRHHSVKRIIQEMDILINKYGAKEIIFRDDTFTIDKKFVRDLCNEIINKKWKIKWTCMTRVNLVDENLLKLMSKAGCWSMHYGVESGSQRLLDLIQKDIKLEQAFKAIKWTKKAGIDVKAFFMLGLPSETREDSLRTIETMKECGADWVQVTITVPYPGTKLYTLAMQEKTLRSFKWEDYQTWAGWSDKELVYVTKGRNADDLKRLQKRAMREFYYRPKFILKQLLNLRIDNFQMYLNGAWALFKN